MRRTAAMACVSVVVAVAFASPAGATTADPRLLASQHVDSGGSVPVATAIGDLTGDGMSDLAVANGAGGTAGTDDLVFVFPQQVDGTLSNSPFSVTPSAPSDAYELAIGNLNGDADPDLAVGIPGDGIDLFYGSNGGLPATPDVTINDDLVHLAVGDLNGDGLDDLLYTKVASPFDLVLRTQIPGVGGFAAPTTVASGVQATGLSLGDLDGNGTTDLALDGAAATKVTVFSQDPTLHTLSGSTVPVPTSVSRSFLADLNGDGMADLVIDEDGGAGIAWAPSNGDGTFGAFTTVGGPAFAAEEVGDLNGDGRVDLATFGGEELRVYVQEDTGGLAQPCMFPATDVVGGDAATSVGDLTGDGGADLAAAEGGGQIGAATVFSQLVGSQKLPTDLSLAPTAPSISYGEKVTLSGALSNPDGGCVRTGSVTIHRKAPNGTVTDIGTAPLAGDLTFSLDDQPPSGGTFTYWATWDGDATHTAAESPHPDVSVSKTATSLSLKASTPTVVFGHSVTLRSTLTGSSGSPRVAFYSFAGGKKTKIGDAVAGGDGVATLTTTPSRNASYQAVFKGNGGLLPSSSSKVTVNVRVVVVGKMVKYDAFKNGVAIYDCCKAFYSFLVKPKHPGGVVRVAVQYLSHGTWRHLPSAVNTFKLGPDGTDQIFLHVAGGKGFTFRVRAYFASDGDHVGAWSSFVRFHFR